MRTPFCASLLLVALTSTAFAQESVNIGKLRVRADSPLAKSEYPRLIITRAQLPAIRARLDNPEIQKYLQQAKDLVKIGKADTLLLAALYQLTGDATYADAAKKTLGGPGWDPAWVFAFDMVAETMTEAERADYAKRLLQSVREGQWRPRLLQCLAAWGNGVDAELIPFIQTAYAHEVVETRAYNDRWTQGRGGSSMGHGYHGEHFFSAEYAAALGWTNATGEDALSTADFDDQQPAWYIYHYLPWQRTRQVIRVGVTMSPYHWQAMMPDTFLATNYVMNAITQTRNGLGQWWQREFIGNWPQPKWRPGEEHVYGLAGRLLWLDPAIPSIPPERFPETRLFPENGHVVMRSDWTADATVALFRCGRFGEIDGYNGRNNLDNLHFMIYKGGYLAPPTGCRHAVNENVWKMSPPGNVNDYGKHTIAMNSITVGRERFEYRGYENRLLGLSLRGGQIATQDPKWFEAWGIQPAQGGTNPWIGFKEGDITAYATSLRYDYACGDATHSYLPSRVKSITRQFIYLKPDTFVIFDRVLPGDEKLEVIWNLHAYRTPEWNGKTEPAKAPEQFIMVDGKRAPNPAPGGHFLHTGGDAFRIANEDGLMESRTLLPETDDRIVRTIGGRWHDFEVDGVNYGPTEETYAELDRRKGDGGLQGVGGWRIEVSPKAVRGEVQFLHVLRVGLEGKFQPAESELVRGEGTLGARVKADGRTFEVTFSTAGATGGHLKIVEGDKTLVDEALVTKIDDNYDRWKDDPRYQDWMTNEFMRTVIFPYGRKAAE
jgi:hypothetical protein